MAAADAQPARDAIAALRTTHDDLAALVGRLDGDALRTVSGSSEWSVAAVLSHLGSAAEIGLATLTAGRSDPEAMAAVWDRWNALSPEEQAAGVTAAEAALLAALESLDDDALVTRRIDMGFLPEPIDIAFFVAMRLSEVGLHRWDVDVAFDDGAVVPAAAVPFVLAVLRNFAGFFAKPGGRTGVVGVTTTDPDGAFVLDVGPEAVTLTEGRPSGPAGSAVLPAEAFVRLLAGRLGPAHTPPSVVVEGDVTLDDLRRLFPGY